MTGTEPDVGGSRLSTRLGDDTERVAEGAVAPVLVVRNPDTESDPAEAER